MLLFFLVLGQAPSFALPDLEGNEVVLDSLLTRGIVVVDFWATWCKPCLKELDFWKKLSQEFDSVTFVAINVDGPQTQRKVPLLVKSHEWDFVILLDDKKIQSLYQVKAIPYTFIIGKDREILYQHVGFSKKEEEILRNKLASLVKKSKLSD